MAVAVITKKMSTEHHLQLLQPARSCTPEFLKKPGVKTPELAVCCISAKQQHPHNNPNNGQESWCYCFSHVRQSMCAWRQAHRKARPLCSCLPQQEQEEYMQLLPSREVHCCCATKHSDPQAKRWTGSYLQWYLPWIYYLFVCTGMYNHFSNHFYKITVLTLNLTETRIPRATLCTWICRSEDQRERRKGCSNKGKGGGKAEEEGYRKPAKEYVCCWVVGLLVCWFVCWFVCVIYSRASIHTSQIESLENLNSVRQGLKAQLANAKSDNQE